MMERWMDDEKMMERRKDIDKERQKMLLIVQAIGLKLMPKHIGSLHSLKLQSAFAIAC
jgi:hypothetical protein